METIMFTAMALGPTAGLTVMTTMIAGERFSPLALRMGFSAGIGVASALVLLVMVASWPSLGPGALISSPEGEVLGWTALLGGFLAPVAGAWVATRMPAKD